MAGVELYIYYKLEPTEVDAVLVAFDGLRAALQSRLPGLQSRLLKRPAPAQAQQTWMEVHTWPQGAEPPPDWQALIEHLAQPMALLLSGTRHCELFEPLR